MCVLFFLIISVFVYYKEIEVKFVLCEIIHGFNFNKCKYLFIFFLNIFVNVTNMLGGTSGAL